MIETVTRCNLDGVFKLRRCWELSLTYFKRQTIACVGPLDLDLGDDVGGVVDGFRRVALR